MDNYVKFKFNKPQLFFMKALSDEECERDVHVQL